MFTICNHFLSLKWFDSFQWSFNQYIKFINMYYVFIWFFFFNCLLIFFCIAISSVKWAVEETALVLCMRGQMNIYKNILKKFKWLWPLGQTTAFKLVKKKLLSCNIFRTLKWKSTVLWNFLWKSSNLFTFHLWETSCKRISSAHAKDLCAPVITPQWLAGNMDLNTLGNFSVFSFSCFVRLS